MLHYIKADNMKYRRTFVHYLILIAPAVALLLAVVLNSGYFVMNSYNWWYVMVFPATAALVSALMNRYEERKMHYRAVLCLPVSLQKVWISKTIVAAFYMACAQIVHLLGIIGGRVIFNTEKMQVLNITNFAVASVVIWVCSLWQIPFCLFLARKSGMMAALLINAGCGAVLGVLIAVEKIWWLCPYSWADRLIIAILHILPNGMAAQPNDPLIDSGVILPGILLSVAFFAGLLFLTAEWFARQEAKE